MNLIYFSKTGVSITLQQLEVHLFFMLVYFIFICGCHCELTFDCAGHWPKTSGVWTMLCTLKIWHDVQQGARDARSMFRTAGILGDTSRFNISSLSLTSLEKQAYMAPPFHSRFKCRLSQNLSVKLKLQNISKILLCKCDHKSSRQLVWIYIAGWRMVAKHFHDTFK